MYQVGTLQRSPRLQPTEVGFAFPPDIAVKVPDTAC